MPDINSKIPYLANLRGDVFVVKKQFQHEDGLRYLYRVTTRDRVEAHKLSALIQNLCTGDIKTYKNMKQDIYDPLSLQHLQQSFIDKHHSDLCAFEKYHDTTIQSKLEGLQRQRTEQQLVVKHLLQKSLDPKNSYAINKTEIDAEFKLVEKVRSLRDKLAKEITGRQYIVTDFGDVESIINDKIIANLSASASNRKMKIGNRFILQSDVLSKEKCTDSYRIPALAAQGHHYLKANRDIPKNVPIGLYKFKNLRRSEYNRLHPHPITRNQHQAYAFSQHLLPIRHDTFTGASKQKRFSKEKQKKVDKLIKNECNHLKKLGFNPNRNNWTKTIELHMDVHCHFGGNLTNENSQSKDRLLTYMNDCRQNLAKHRTATEKRLQNVDFYKIAINWFPMIIAITNKLIKKEGEVVAYYSDYYSDSSIENQYYNEMIEFVNNMTDKYTKN